MTTESARFEKYWSKVKNQYFNKGLTFSQGRIQAREEFSAIDYLVRE